MLVKYTLVKVARQVQHGKYSSRPRPSAIFPVVHERKQYFNWIIVGITDH